MATATRPRWIERPVGAARRPDGAGRLLLRTMRDSGNQSYSGSWYVGRRRVKRCVGPARGRRARGGLTQKQAEEKLRDIIAASHAEADEPPVTDRLTVEEVGARYVAHAARRGRKKGTLQDIESDIRVHFVPFFEDTPIDAIVHDDVDDLMGVLERKGLAPKTIRDHIGTL